MIRNKMNNSIVSEQQNMSYEVNDTFFCLPFVSSINFTMIWKLKIKFGSNVVNKIINQRNVIRNLNDIEQNRNNKELYIRLNV